MHEFGIGRAANVAIASLPGFTLPGDISGSDKYYAKDLVDPPIVAVRGTVTVSGEPGIGCRVLPEIVRKAVSRSDAFREWGPDRRSVRVPQHPRSMMDLSDEIFTWFDRDREFFLGFLRAFVERESPSRDKAACDACASWLAKSGWGIHFPRLIANAGGGDHVVLRVQFPNDSRGEPMPTARKPALILAHYDTVWPLGTAERRPFEVNGTIARGPGVFDMKASLLILRLAIGCIPPPFRNYNVLITSDEEIGSPTSRVLIEEMARESEYVLVLEPPLPDGSLKTSRKGVGGYTIEARGLSAHAGVEPEKGANAVVELSHQIMGLQLLNNPRLGTTLNVGTIEGGTTPNVVPDRASCRLDVRAATIAEAERIDSALRSLRSVTPGTTLHVSGGFNRPPMERTPAIASLFERAREIGRTLGMELTEGSTGGGSDGNFTAALGIPTLDGLGALGGGAHAEDEHVLIDSIPERAALLAALLMNL
jgi:glutamate carboxypeptidase